MTTEPGEPWDGTTPLELGTMQPGESVDVPITPELAQRIMAQREEFDRQMREMHARHLRWMLRLLIGASIYALILVLNAFVWREQLIFTGLNIFLTAWSTYQFITRWWRTPDWRWRFAAVVLLAGCVSITVADLVQYL